MEEFKKKQGTTPGEREIAFSQTVKAGKRIYYLDVKKNRNDEMFLAITESKKVVSGEGDDAQVSFEKHKIFLYKEDFEKFMRGLNAAVDYIKSNDETTSVENDTTAEASGSVNTASDATDTVSDTAALNHDEIKIDIDF